MNISHFLYCLFVGSYVVMLPTPLAKYKKTLSSCCRHSRQQMDVMICYVKEKWALKLSFLVLFSLSPGMCHRCAYQFFKKSCATVNSVEFRQVKTIFNFKWWKVFCAAFLPCVCRLVKLWSDTREPNFFTQSSRLHEQSLMQFSGMRTSTEYKYDVWYCSDNLTSASLLIV